MTLDMLNVQAAPIVGNSPPDPRALEIVDGLKQTAACRTPPGMVEVIRRERAGVMTVQTDEAHVLVIAPSVDVEAVRISTEQFSRSEEHTSELQSLMRISYAVFCLKKKMHDNTNK